MNNDVKILVLNFLNFFLQNMLVGARGEVLFLVRLY